MALRLEEATVEKAALLAQSETATKVALETAEVFSLELDVPGFAVYVVNGLLVID